MPIETLVVLVDSNCNAIKALDMMTNQFAETHHIISVGGIHFLPAVLQEDFPVLTRTIIYEECYSRVQTIQNMPRYI